MLLQQPLAQHSQTNLTLVKNKPENFSGFFAFINNCMSYRIRCYTLFDITQTGVLIRRAPINLTEAERIDWENRRNSQSNFDTIVQVINLRSQPEEMSVTTSSYIKFKEFQKFGFMYEDEEDQLCWEFDFSIAHKSVFDDGITELGALFDDCEGVPMIKHNVKWDKLSGFLDTSPELRNIYFEVISNA